jgi:hypothetical protein
MSRDSNCRCLVCGMERHLEDHFAAPRGQEECRRLARSSFSLSVFPDAFGLVGYLHSYQMNGNPAKDPILIELLQKMASGAPAVQELLLLAFVPVLHSVVRHVATRYPALPSDDIAQHTVTAFLELCGSPECLALASHVAFAMARLLRRNAFAWAERESRACAVEPSDEEDFGAAMRESHNPVEQAIVLRHFLDRCHQRGVISGEDLELLVQVKLEESPAREYSNASRQRMKRLVGKLRRAAKPRRKFHDDRQLRLF